jgi:hypothetical protein
MFSKLPTRILYFALLLLLAVKTNAQPILPEMTGATDKGINVLSWICQYDGIKSIAVQRSSDSIFNYVTVGYVKNLKKGPQAFIDGHPAPGANWYRLYIVFNSDLTWNSNRFRLDVDSAAIIAKGVLPPNDSLQKLAARVKVDSTIVKRGNIVTTIDSGSKAYTVDSLMADVPKLLISISIPDPDEIDAYSYLKSQYVFTNPFTGHVTLDIPNAAKHHYSVTFFNNENKQIMEIPKVTAPQVIIDKRNFQKKGLYKFELREDRKKLESGYITIY